MKFKKIKAKSWQFLLAGIIFIFMLSAFVNAFAIGFESTELRLHPGETYNGAFSLQNYGVGSGDITVEATVEEGAQYVTFTEGTTIDVLANNNAAAPVRFTIPANAKVGDSYPVKILFKVISGNVGGNEAESGGTTVGFAFSYRREINLKVVPETPAETPSARPAILTIAIILALAIIIVIVIILWLVIKNKKKEPESSLTKPISQIKRK